MKLGNIIFLTPIRSVGSLFLKIEWFLRNAVAHHELNITTRTHTTLIHTHITISTTTPVTVIGDSKWLACPIGGGVKTRAPLNFTGEI
jgi:hypothetical protein